MLRIIKNRKPKYKNLGIYVYPDEWDFKKNKPKLKCPNREAILNIIRQKETEIQSEIIELNTINKEYTPQSLLSPNKKVTIKTVEELFEKTITQLKEENRLNYARIFKHTKGSIKKFCNNNLDFLFPSIDVEWLSKYELWLRKNNCNEVTIATVFRILRRMYNIAITEKCAAKDSYPFNEFKISKFDITTEKRAIPKEAIKKIIETDVEEKDHYTKLSKDLFIFSYLCGGINYTDIAHLKQSNLVDGKLKYIRKKTGKKINIPLSNETLVIINKYLTEDNAFIFPILHSKIHLTELQKFNRLHKVLAKINNSLRKVSELAEIKGNITTYVARHSFATILKNSGVNIALISETLGHSDLKTTQIYLDSFESSQIGEAFKNLL